jgi:adenylate cyclase
MAEAAEAQRRLAAILAADVAGYSRLMGRDEEGTLSRLKALRRELIDPTIAEHRGRIVKTAGDGMLVEFHSVLGAMRCAVAVQEAMAARAAAVAADSRIQFRVGINLGDVILDEGDIFGDGVNIAARLEGLAEPGGICISAVVHDQVQGRLDCGFDDLGEQQLKNIARPVRVYRVALTHPRPSASGTLSRTAGEGAEPAGLARGEAGEGLALPDKPSIAVLPFQNMSGDPEQEYFADGIAEDVITLLSKSRGLFVIARNSSFTYKGRAVDIKQVARELGVRYVLEGSVRKAAGRVRVTAQLIEAAAGGHLWAERYDRDLTDIFAVQDDITASVTTAILPAVEQRERERAVRQPPDSLNAWECYHRGLWHYAQKAPAETATAASLFERAIRLDPGFATAQAALSLALATQAVRFRPFAERQALTLRAAEHAQKSVALDPSDSFGHCSLALALMLLGQHEEAMAEADLAVKLDPNSARAYGYQGMTRAFGGRPQEAIAPTLTALRLSPFDPFKANWLHHLGRAYYQIGDYPAAIAAARQVCQSYPDYQAAYLTLIAALGQAGQAGEAQRVAADAATRFGEDFRRRLGRRPPDVRVADHEHFVAGCRKAGILP